MGNEIEVIICNTSGTYFTESNSNFCRIKSDLCCTENNNNKGIIKLL